MSYAPNNADDSFIPMAVPVEAEQAADATVAMSVPEPPRVQQDQVNLLRQQGYARGLAQSLTSNLMAFPLRIWVVDNSGSMNLSDGHKLVATSKISDVRLVECTRWAEIQDTVDYHAQLAALLKAPTVFRLLNNPGPQAGPQQFSIADKGEDMIEQDLHVARETMRKASPSGVTPLTQHVLEIRETVLAMSSMLNGGKVAVIFATDGLPTDHHGYGGEAPKREFLEALRSLEGLPLWIVVRLCTDDADVVDFYSSLDQNLELSVEVLDDFIGEAEEVYKHNPWLNYALPLHRCREMGYFHRLLDLIDERPLNKAEVQEFCRLLLGDDALEGAPDAVVEFDGFLRSVEKHLKQDGNQWNPAHRRMTPWIDTRALQRQYGEGFCSIM